MKFGEKIRRYRENNNLTQKDLGDQLHLTDDAIYKWKAGKSFPDVPMLRNLVELTGYDAETLTNDNRSIEAYYGLPVSAKTFLYEKTINAREPVGLYGRTYHGEQEQGYDGHFPGRHGDTGLTGTTAQGFGSAGSAPFFLFSKAGVERIMVE